MKAEYLMSIETSESLLEEIGAQVLTTAAYQLPESVIQAIDAVTQDDVVKVSASTEEVVILNVNHHKFRFTSVVLCNILSQPTT